MKQLNAGPPERGHAVGAEGLVAPAQARLVRAVSASAALPEVTGRSFAESKEFLAGYWIVDGDSGSMPTPSPHAWRRRAGRWAGIPIEVREVMASAPIEV